MNNIIRIRSLKDSDFDWLPDCVRFPPSRLNLDFPPSPGALQRFGTPDRLSYRDFIKTIPVIAGKGKGGLSDPDRYPYQAHALELLDHPCLRDIVITAGNQSAKTRTIEIFLFWRAFYDPADAIIYYPDRTTVRERFSKAIIPTIQHPNFSQIATGIEDDLTKRICRLASGMDIESGHMSSLMEMSNRSGVIIVLEELDKVKEKLDQTEAAVKFLTEGRGRDAEEDYKGIKTSTLSVDTAPCAKARAEAEIFVDFLAKCPHCHRFEYLNQDRVGYVQDKSLFGKIKTTPSFAWYHCGRCGAKWNERQRVVALRAGSLRVRKKGWKKRKKEGLEPLHDPRPLKKYLDEEWPGSAALSIPSLCLPTVKLCQWAAAKIDADNDLEAKHFFYNHHLDEPFSGGGRIRNPADILARTSGQPFGVVPSGWQCAGLYCGVDSQKGKYYYWVSAIGFSTQADGTKQRPMLWQVEAGELPSIDENGNHIPIELVLAPLENKVYRDEAGNTSWPGGQPVQVWNGHYLKNRRGKLVPQLTLIGGEYKIRLFVIDGRGNNLSNDNLTEEAKRWCAGDLARRRLYWGEGMSTGKLYNATRDEQTGIWIYHADRSQLESWVERGLDIKAGRQGSILVSDECADYPWMGEHLANVSFDPRSGRYVKPKRGRRDIRDCLRMSFLGYRIELMDGVVMINS